LAKIANIAEIDTIKTFFALFGALSSATQRRICIKKLTERSCKSRSEPYKAENLIKVIRRLAEAQKPSSIPRKANIDVAFSRSARLTSPLSHSHHITATFQRHILTVTFLSLATLKLQRDTSTGPHETGDSLSFIRRNS
jgi:hypothetical protein